MRSISKLNSPAYLACLLLSFAMGGLHAYGAFLESVELSLGVDRVAASLVYGVSLVGATLGVLMVPRLLRQQSAPVITAILLSFTLLALLLVHVGNYTGWLIGYGVFYGLASGGGYGLCLSLAPTCLGSGRQGLAIGGVTAAFALGSAWFTWLISALLELFSVIHVFTLAMMQVLLLSVLAIYLWWRWPLMLSFIPAAHLRLNSIGVWSLWLIYGLGVFAGLMVLGHALPILKSASVTNNMAVYSLAFMALANGLACIMAGSLGDRFGFLRVLKLVLCASALSLLLMSVAEGWLAVLIMLLISALYGAFISLYPALVSLLYGQQSGPQVYSRIFTAWGLAGLTAAPLAGWILLTLGSYQPALWLAASLGLLGVIGLTIRGERV